MPIPIRTNAVKRGALALRGVKILLKRTGAINKEGKVPSQNVMILNNKSSRLSLSRIIAISPYSNPQGKKILKSPIINFEPAANRYPFE